METSSVVVQLDHHSEVVAHYVIIEWPYSHIAISYLLSSCVAGVGILYKKKKPPPPNLFSFMEPLSVDVWIYMITLYLATSILMFLLGR